MSTLVIQLPSRQRLSARGPAGSESEGSGLATEYEFVTTPDGLMMQLQGGTAASLLPKANTVIAVLGDADVSWHRITLPKAPAARMRAALVGVLEDALLEDAEAVHLALAPQASAGQPTWIAAVDRRWLRNELAVLEKADVFVDRVVPMAWPDDPPIGHFAEIENGNGDRSTHGIALNWAHADGVASVRLQGGLARALVPNPAPPGTRWSATPGAASAAEQWLGGPVPVMPPGERLLQAARSLWNLRQFDLTQRTRGARALRDSLRRFFSPEWRPVRIGVLVLAAAQILGLNLWALHQRSSIDAKRAEMRSLAKQAFPRVSELDIQRDPMLVVARETQTLRTQAGKPGDSDFETLLQAAASAWPGDRPPAENLRFEPGRLNFSATGWNDAQIEQFRSLLRPGGWQVDASEGRLTLSRAAIRGSGGTP
ncbi:MAG TPA: type II secretion system protein GspL [Burkholderiaceae bacterium]|nr:type II secretion system protein GspL [Burkholderiaceae bacterium]